MPDIQVAQYAFLGFALALAVSVAAERIGWAIERMIKG